MALPITFAPAQVLEASQLNDNFNFVDATYTSYTPTITGWTPGNGTVTRAVYSKTGNTVNAQGYWTFGSTSVVPASNTFNTTMPVNAVSVGSPQMFGICAFFDLSADVVVTGVCQIKSPNLLAFFWDDPETAPLAVRPVAWNTNAVMPFTFATGDIVSWNITYQAA